MKNKRSFTLIELLMVIAIIGIIATFITVSVRSAQSRARDAKRVSDLEALNTAIQMYYRETGRYPDLPLLCGTNGINGVSSDQVTRWATGHCLTRTDYIADYDTNNINVFVPKYIPKLPVDPGPQVYQDGKAIRGFVYFHSNVNSLGIECYKIMAFNPENPKSTQYKSIWDQARDGGGNDSEVDGTGVWAWSLYSRGCEAK